MRRKDQSVRSFARKSSSASPERFPAQCGPVVRTLGGITRLLTHNKTRTLNGKRFTGHAAKYICTLPDQTLYFWSDDLDIDDDGYHAKEGMVLINKPTDWKPDEDFQPQTSLPGLSAFLDPYIVLPSGNDNSRNSWYQRNTRCRLGDGAVVIAGDGRWALAVFGDEGPGNKIGEMSLATHAKFTGWETRFIKKEGYSLTRQENPETGPMITLVFPGTKGRRTDPYDPAAVLEETKRRFWALTGHKEAPI